jgi:hypothetical protein
MLDQGPRMRDQGPHTLDQEQDAYQLQDWITRDDGQVFCTGVQALARLPIEQLRADRAAGHRTAAFASGYPGSPLGGLDLELARAARLAPELPIVLRPAVNEELGVSAVMGSQLASTRPDARYDGVVGLWYGKAPGLDRASDALRHAVFAGTSHPPLLRALGRERKIKVGTWAAPGLALLAKGKRLRGTPWDPFGHTRVRRAERKLAADYRRAIDEVIDGLTTERLDRAIEIASLPATVRGYEHRKLDGIEHFDATLPTALDAYGRTVGAKR